MEEQRINPDSPPSHLPTEVLRELLSELSLPSVQRRDWKGLAGFLGFSYPQITLLEQLPFLDRALTMLCKWEDARPGGATLRVLVYAFTALDFRSCLDILQKQSPAIATISRDWKLSSDQKDLRTSLFPNLSTDVTFFKHVQSRRSDRTARSPGEVPTCSPALSMSPQDPLQPDEQFSAATHMEYHVQAPQNLRTESAPPSASSPRYRSRSVYISYHPGETSERQQLITELADQIRAQRYTVFYDKFCEADIQQQGLMCWKEWAISQCKNIVVICTPKYYREDSEFSSPRKFRLRTHSPKITVDCQLLRTIAFSREDSSRLIPVILEADSPNKCTPMWLKAHRSYSWPRGEYDFLLCIQGLPKYELPPVAAEPKIVRPRQIYFRDAPKWDPYDAPRHR